MPILIRNTPVKVSRNSGFNEYGESQEEKSVTMMVAVLKLSDLTSKTSIGSGQTASRGRVDVDVADVKLIFAPDAKIKNEDEVQLYNLRLKVVDVFPRANMLGDLSKGHLEVTLIRAAG